jgi:hypothetical protein
MASLVSLLLWLLLILILGVGTALSLGLLLLDVKSQVEVIVIARRIVYCCLVVVGYPILLEYFDFVDQFLFCLLII